MITTSFCSRILRNITASLGYLTLISTSMLMLGSTTEVKDYYIAKNTELHIEFPENIDILTDTDPTISIEVFAEHLYIQAYDCSEKKRLLVRSTRSSRQWIVQLHCISPPEQSSHADARSQHHLVAPQQSPEIIFVQWLWQTLLAPDYAVKPIIGVVAHSLDTKFGMRLRCTQKNPTQCSDSLRFTHIAHYTYDNKQWFLWEVAGSPSTNLDISGLDLIWTYASFLTFSHKSTNRYLNLSSQSDLLLLTACSSSQCPKSN